MLGLLSHPSEGLLLAVLSADTAAPVPQESMSNLSATPAFSTTLLNMASAVGLRQIFPACGSQRIQGGSGVTTAVCAVGVRDRALASAALFSGTARQLACERPAAVATAAAGAGCQYNYSCKNPSTLRSFTRFMYPALPSELPAGASSAHKAQNACSCHMDKLLT